MALDLVVFDHGFTWLGRGLLSRRHQGPHVSIALSEPTSIRRRAKCRPEVQSLINATEQRPGRNATRLKILLRKRDFIVAIYIDRCFFRRCLVSIARRVRRVHRFEPLGMMVHHISYLHSTLDILLMINRATARRLNEPMATMAFMALSPIPDTRTVPFCLFYASYGTTPLHFYHKVVDMQM